MAAHSQQILSLCSGVGMLDIGVECGLDYLGFAPRVVGFCERDAFAASILVARMEESALGEAAVSDDLRDFDARWRGCVDWIVAGFPCQPWSVAGKQSGRGDERWIWDDILRVIDDVQPTGLFLENVPGLCSGEAERGTLADGTEVAVRRDGLDAVLRSLAKRGFDAEWLHLSAKAVGASHKRERVFVMAYSRRAIDERWHDSGSVGEVLPGVEGETRERQRARDDAGDCGSGLDDTSSPRHEQAEQGADIGSIGQRGGQCVSGNGRRRMGDPASSQPGTDAPAGGSRDSTGESGSGLEHSLRTGSRQRAGRERTLDGDSGSGGRLGDTPQLRLQGGRGEHAGEQLSGPGSGELFAPERDRELWNRIIERWPHLAPAISATEAESIVRRMAHGDSNWVDGFRADRLRCVGNAVVPLQAAFAFAYLALNAGILNR